jgi:predicted nucleic-acid-binding protein
MVSIDTNILIRLLTNDDKSQAARAKRLFAKEHIYITKTVILEAEWVLRYAYDFSAEAIAKAFLILLGQDKVTIEDSHHIARATTLLQKGMDFADALHLTCSQGHLFFTFDKKLVSKATTTGLNSVQLL